MHNLEGFSRILIISLKEAIFISHRGNRMYMGQFISTCNIHRYEQKLPYITSYPLVCLFVGFAIPWVLNPVTANTSLWEALVSSAFRQFSAADKRVGAPSWLEGNPWNTLSAWNAWEQEKNAHFLPSTRVLFTLPSPTSCKWKEETHSKKLVN